MLTVKDHGRSRRAHQDGMSIREMARRFHHSRRKIRDILRGDQAEPAAYPVRARQTAPKMGTFHGRILEILKKDEDAPPKQRHTAMRIFERLRDEEGYQGQYDAVRHFVKKHRESKRDTFIPLDHDAGQRVEADFRIRSDENERHVQAQRRQRRRNNQCPEKASNTLVVSRKPRSNEESYQPDRCRIRPPGATLSHRHLQPS